MTTATFWVRARLNPALLNLQGSDSLPAPVAAAAGAKPQDQQAKRGAKAGQHLSSSARRLVQLRVYKSFCKVEAAEFVPSSCAHTPRCFSDEITWMR